MGTVERSCQGSMDLYEEQRGTVTGELWLGHLPDLTPHSSSGCECESESENSGEAGSERKHASMLGEYDIARAFPTRPNRTEVVWKEYTFVFVAS